MHLFALFYSLSGLMLATLAAPTARRQSLEVSKIVRQIDTPNLAPEPAALLPSHSDTRSQAPDVFATVDLGDLEATNVERGIEEEAKPQSGKLLGCVIA
ncbi:hypothetical protein C8R45DRAFT_1038791 [Mycena sanguinolenta]|nr:hypothetical protein C8R45DRAFT_1038791 [Mycena sanguinolenta]